MNLRSKNFLLAPLLLFTSFLNLGFTKESDFAILLCGRQDTISESYLKDSNKNKILKNKEIIETLTWIINKKTGKLYVYDFSSNKFSPLTNQYDYTYDGIDYKVSADSEIDGNIVKIKYVTIGNERQDELYVIDLKKNTETIKSPLGGINKPRNCRRYKMNEINEMRTPIAKYSDLSYPAWTNYNVEQTCRLLRPGSSVFNTSLEKVPLMLYSNQNPYYDLNAASEFRQWSDPSITDEANAYIVTMNIIKGIYKKCPNKIAKEEIKIIEGAIKEFELGN